MKQRLTMQEIEKSENKHNRTIYKYISLNYLSPNIVSDILDAKIPTKINLQELFKIATLQNFSEQETAFYG